MLKDNINSDEDKKIKYSLSEFCFMAIDEEENENMDDLQQIFEDLDKDSVMLTKKNKELKEKMKIMANKNKKLTDKVVSMEKKLEKTTSIDKYLEDLEENNKELLKVDLKCSQTYDFIKKTHLQVRSRC